MKINLLKRNETKLYIYMEIERNSKLSSDIFNEIELKR